MLPRRLAVAAPIAVAVAVALAACQPAAPAAAAFSAADEAAVHGGFDSTLVWFHAGKFEQWAGLWTEDAAFQPSNMKAVTGRAGLLGWTKSLPPIEELQFTNVKVTGVGDVAYATSDFTLKFKGAPADTGKQLVVFRRQPDGKWLGVAGAFNSDLPLPQTGAVQAGSPKGGKKP